MNESDQVRNHPDHSGIVTGTAVEHADHPAEEREQNPNDWMSKMAAASCLRNPARERPRYHGGEAQGTSPRIPGYRR